MIGCVSNSALYRKAYAAFVIGTASLVALLYFVAHANLYSQMAHKCLVDTVHYLVEHPIQLWIIGILSLLFGFRAVDHPKDLAGALWSVYGDRLESLSRPIER